MADQTFIKPEQIKPEPGASPNVMDEEDMYEDAGDLEFYDKSAPHRAFETLYLARVPKYIWESWHKLTERLGDDDEIQIGTLRTWNEQVNDTSAEGGTRDVTRLQMLLSADCPEHQALPREYDLDVLDRNVTNHFIFSEEDLPGFKAKNKARAEAAKAGFPSSLLNKPKEGGVSKPTYDRRSRYQPYFRKAIPKKTKIYGKVAYDVRVEPRNAQEEERLLARRIFEAENNKSKLKIISRNKASTIGTAGTIGSVNWGSNFGKTAQAAKPKKGEHLKAARIPEDQLLDLIFECFRQYQYWSMKALRQKLVQPDSYLRSVLEKVAVLNKSGPFANNYCLNEAYRDQGGSEAKEAAAEAADDGPDDEGEEMEDVLPSV